MRIDIKPLSVNRAYKGRRFRTDEYKNYEIEVLYKLKAMKLPKKPYKLRLAFGVSSKLMDVDNGAKPFIDLLQKKYNFNDRDIYELTIRKEDVKKGMEFIEFEFEHIKIK